MENLLKVGDKVYHVSLPSIVWVIIKLNENNAICSTVIKETLEKKTETFSLKEIKKIKENEGNGGIIFSNKTRNNHY